MQLQPDISNFRHEDVPRAVMVWEASVRATHHFVSEADIALFRPMVQAALASDALSVVCVRDADGDVAGFIGVAEGHVEMLFVHPDYFGRGGGRRLLSYAVDHCGARTLEVNEQNPQAVGFYERMGFVIVGRSEHDGMGKPYPLLHMRLKAS